MTLEIKVKTKKTPKLRFPGFLGEWEEKRLGKVCTKIGSGSTPRGGERVYQKSGVPFIRSQNITADKLFMNKVTYISDETNKQMSGSIVQPSDVLLNITGASIGRSCVVPESFKVGNVNQHVCIIRPDNAYSPYFIQLFLASFEGQKAIMRTQVGGGREGLNFQGVRSLKFSSPAFTEQQKIAEFLGSTDKWIENLRAQKESLKKYKKGMMQKIFLQKTRFKDNNGNNFPAWGEKRLGDCLDYEQPTKYIVTSTEYDDSYDTPVLTAGKSFIMGFTNECGGILKNNLPVIIFDDFTTSSQFVNFPFKVKSSAMKILRRKDGFDVKFIYELMQTIKYEVGGHGRHWISKYSNIKILVPTLAEQQKISDFLITIDNLIESKQQQITQTEQWKKGLIQQMFV